MLSQFKTLNPETLTVIMYSNSPSLEGLCLDQIRRRCDVDKDFMLDVATAKEAKDTKYKVNFAPLRGTKWAVVINGDKLAEKEVVACIGDAFDTCIKIVRTSDYRVYKKLVACDVVKHQSNLAVTAYGGKLIDKDIEALCAVEGVTLDESLVTYLARSYRFEVQQVCDLFSLIKSGYSVASQKDIISAIGVGGATIQSFVLNLAEIAPKDLKAQKKIIRSNLSLLEDLTYKYSYSQLHSFILDTIAGLIDIKTEMITGNFNRFSHLAPESFNLKRQKRYARLARYAYRLESVNDTMRSRAGFKFKVDKAGVTLQRLLLMQHCFKPSGGHMIPREKLVFGLFKFVSIVGTSALEVADVTKKSGRKSGVCGLEPTSTSPKIKKTTLRKTEKNIQKEPTLLDLLGYKG